MRSAYVESAQKGFTLHQFKGRNVVTSQFEPDLVSDDVNALIGDGVDVVVLCMSYAGLRGPWLGELMRQIGDATVFTLVPGQSARALLLEHLSEELPVALAKSGLTLPSPDQLRQPHHIETNQRSKLTQAASKLLQYYSPTTIRAVADLYAADFKLGRYSTDPRSLGLSPLVA